MAQRHTLQSTHAFIRLTWCAIIRILDEQLSRVRGGEASCIAPQKYSRKQ